MILKLSETGFIGFKDSHDFEIVGSRIYRNLKISMILKLSGKGFMEF